MPLIPPPRRDDRDDDIVAALDALRGDLDPEAAHGAADALLLRAVSPRVRAAYARLVKRARYWATS